MPNYDEKKLEFQTRIGNLLQMMGLDAPDARNNRLYADFVTGLNGISDALNLYYTPDETGRCKPLDAAGQAAFDRLFETAIGAADAILGAADPGKAAQYRRDICAGIREMLEKDRRTLKQLNAGCGLSMPEILREARTDFIDLTGQQLSTVGGNLSSRIAVSYTDEHGVEQRGFFTKATKARSKKQLTESLRAKAGEYPRYQAVFGPMLEIMDVGDYLQDMSVFEDMDPAWMTSFIRRNLTEFDAQAPENLQMLESEAFQRAFFDVYHTGYQLSAELGANSGALDLKAGANIDSRSTAMSIVAGLLGRPKLIAGSRNMKIRVGDEIVEGTFIAEAKGIDLTRVSDPDDPLLRATEKELDNPDVNRDLCDLAILDIICGNVDRHSGNLIYQFDSSGRIVGAVGIDNDASFPNRKMLPQRSMGLNGHPLDQDMAVSAEMAAKILSLDAGTLRYALSGTKLEPGAIQRCAERLELVQNRIRNDMEYFRDKDATALEEGHLHVIRDEDWPKIPQRNFAVRQGALYGDKANAPREEIAQHDLNETPIGHVFVLDRFAKGNYEANAARPKDRVQAPVAFARGKLLSQDINVAGRTGQLNQTLPAHGKELADLLRVFRYLDRDLKVSKPSEYSKFAKAFKACEKKMQERLAPDGGGPLTTQEISEFARDFKSVMDLGDFCVEKLRGKQRTEPEQRLLSAVEGIRSAMGQKAAEFHAAIGIKPRTCREAAKLLAEKADAMERQALSGKKPDSNRLKLALAARKYAGELAARPADALYNRELAKAKLNGYVSSKEIGAAAGNVDARRAICTRNISELQFSKKFFFPDAVDESGAFREKLPSRLDLSVSRHALCTLAAAYLLRQGHTLKDIFDPEKLQEERAQAGREIMDLYRNADENTLRNFTADILTDGLEAAMQQTSEALNHLPAIDGKNLCTPENAYLVTAGKFIQDMGQELSRGSVKDTAKALTDDSHVERLLRMQRGGCAALNSLAAGQFVKASLAAGELDAFRGYSEESYRRGDNTGLLMELSEAEIPKLFAGAALEKSLAEEKARPDFDFFRSYSLENPKGVLGSLSKAHAKSLTGETAQLSAFLAAGSIRANAMALGAELLKGNLISPKTVTRFDPEGLELAPMGDRLIRLGKKLPAPKAPAPAENQRAPEPQKTVPDFKPPVS